MCPRAIRAGYDYSIINKKKNSFHRSATVSVKFGLDFSRAQRVLIEKVVDIFSN